MNEMEQLVELMGESVGYVKAGQDIIRNEIKTVKGMMIGLGTIAVSGFVYLAIKDHSKNKKNADHSDRQ